MSVEGQHYLLVVEGKPEMEDGKSMPLRYVNQASGQLTRYKSDFRFAKHEAAVMLVSKTSQLEDSAKPAVGNVTFLRQTAFGCAADMAIAAFQRYASIRHRQGLLPKRSECVEPLQMTPKRLGVRGTSPFSGSSRIPTTNEGPTPASSFLVYHPQNHRLPPKAKSLPGGSGE